MKIDQKILFEEVYRAIEESQNTFAADINEIAVGFFALGGSWDNFMNRHEAQAAVEARKKQLPPEIVQDQIGRAKVMAEEAVKWANANGYDGNVVKVWWTARPGILAKAVGYEVDSRRNPTDTLLQFADGTFLGISAKSTKSSGEIGFKNPGIGSLSQKLGVNLVSFIEKIEQETIAKHKLPLSKVERKQYIRSHPEVQAETIRIGSQILNKLRDALFDFYKVNFKRDQMMEHIKEVWIDASGSDPYYVKVTGHGHGGNFMATVHDPTDNEKLKALSTGKLQMTPVGNDSIGFMADGVKLMKMRFKWESEKLASSIKLSGDPW